MYTQCRLTRQDGNGLYIQMAYIPSHLAKKDNVISLRLPNGKWDEGWTVSETYHTADDIYSARQSRKRHRKNTGDSLPKER